MKLKLENNIVEVYELAGDTLRLVAAIILFDTAPVTAIDVTLSVSPLSAAVSSLQLLRGYCPQSGHTGHTGRGESLTGLVSSRSPAPAPPWSQFLPDAEQS